VLRTTISSLLPLANTTLVPPTSHLPGNRAMVLSSSELHYMLRVSALDREMSVAPS
jgi:hypothetical protein